MIKNLQPPDFKAVAAKGAFVYAYLRSQDSKEPDLTAIGAVAGSPYYIGKSTGHDRPTGKHACPVPTDHSRIRILRSGLTEEEAFEWEIFYIAHYGRIDTGAGILRNLRDGGEGGTCTSAMIASAKKYGYEIEEWQAKTVKERQMVMGRYARGVRGDALKDDVDWAEKRIDDAADRLGIPREAWRNATPQQKARAFMRSQYGAKGIELLAPERTDRAAARFEIDRDDWVAMSGPEKSHHYDFYRARKNFSNKWGVDLCIALKMDGETIKVFSKQFNAATRHNICPLVWWAAGRNGRARFDYNRKHGKTGYEAFGIERVA